MDDYDASVLRSLGVSDHIINHIRSLEKELKDLKKSINLIDISYVPPNKREERFVDVVIEIHKLQLLAHGLKVSDKAKDL